ncbi:uncharacterized protein CPUR_06513 [Claviceps purpurea 20.1]|uniref:Uncharacterized protein n=1 Tax=Claviceps purpurea (strain 20.1) TaxID=1111077 RepID=M1WHF7_CLAP2|nr:uncharacterized protein CPUR_06513 [Claviceps purpurea 20.1]
MTLRIFNARAGISSYQSWTRVIAYRDASIASFGNNVQGAEAVGVGVQGPGLGRFKLVALVILGGPTVVLRYRRCGSAACHRDVEYNRILFVLEIGAQRPFNHGFMCSGWPAERALLPNTSTGMSVHEANTAQSWVRVFSNREGTRATWKASLLLSTRDPVYLSVDIGVLGPIFAPVTATPEFGGGKTHTAVLSG